MPEDQIEDPSDVKNDESAEVGSQEAESSTVDNREAQADAENANTEEQPAKPERTVPLNQHIADRTKYKSTIQALKEENAKLKESKPASTPEVPAAQAADSKAPKMSDPDIDFDPEKFAKKTAAYEVNKAIAADRAEREQEARQTEWTGKMSAFDQNVAKLAEDAPEYAELLNANGNNGHGDEVITQAIIESDAGPEIDYYLLAHPAEVARIAALQGNAKLMAMGEIKAAAKEFASSNIKKGATTQVTQAPRPIAPVSTGGSNTSDPRYDPNVSMADYRAAKNQRASQ